MLPFAWCLAEGKAQSNYIALLKFVDENVMPLNCSMYMTDYERALRNAMAKVVPAAKQSSCWFHFTQAVKRNVMKLPHLIHLLRSNETAKQIYYELLCLPLLPKEYIVEEFEKLKSRANDLNRRVFGAFIKYYENQWLIRVSFIFFGTTSNYFITPNFPFVLKTFNYTGRSRTNFCF